jgi:DNA polymerase-3 subunit epsilon
MLFDCPVACIDVETTGTSPPYDRITEIAVVEMTPDGSVSEWSVLLNPQTKIPEYIERLTGITNRMVENAPTFPEIAGALWERLEGRLFVAHNARFDYAFIKHEFLRIQESFRADTLCTVRLSRKLYPQHHKHNLDSLIERLGIRTEERHRALADARVLVSFLRQVEREHDMDVVRRAIDQVMAKPALPPHIPEGLIDNLPESPGVYLFYGDNAMPLYVGKSNNLRSRVLSHFAADHRSAKELRLSQQIRRIEWRETAGELGALLLEARLVKELHPLHNQRLRRKSDLCSWQMADAAHGGKTLVLQYAADLDFGRAAGLYGLFVSRRQALEALRNLAAVHDLCLIQIGIEKPARRKAAPCFGYQIGNCHGVCMGEEAPLQHDLRLMDALTKLKLQSWPYAGPVGFKEAFGEREELHLVHNWCYLGTARAEADIEDILSGSSQAAFDPDTYKILVKHLKVAKNVIRLF